MSSLGIERPTKYFTSLEGIDFSGKTPVANWLRDELQGRGFDISLTRDPPYFMSPWDQLYELFERGEDISHFSEAMLLLTARVDNYERFIRPSLESGVIVISDRFLDSWFAYQSIRLARYFGTSDDALKFLIDLNESLVKRGLLSYPDRTLLIDMEPEVAMRRALDAHKLSKYEVIETQEKVANQYRKIQEMFPDRITLIDARGIEVPEVYERAKEIVLQELGELGK